MESESVEYLKQAELENSMTLGIKDNELKRKIEENKQDLRIVKRQLLELNEKKRKPS